MTRLVTGPQGIALGTLFLRIVAEEIPRKLRVEFLGDDPDDAVYPDGLGYVRWTLPGTGSPAGDYETVVGSYDSLSLTPQSLQSQPWWGDEELARLVAEQISGGPGGTPEFGNPNGGFFGPWLAYGLVENAGVAAVTYQGDSGILTGSGTFQGPQNSLEYLVEGGVNPGPAANLSGPWMPIYQRQLAIPIQYQGTAPLGFDVIEQQGVVLTGELVSL